MKIFLWILAIVIAGLGTGMVGRYVVADRNATAALKASAAAQLATQDGGYKIGDRLQQNPLVASNPTKTAPAIKSPFQEIKWEDLAPASWDPMKPFKGIDLNKLDDADPRAEAALQKAKDYWKSAPINPAMNGKMVKIPGFVVSLDREGDALKEFLLVPYFGGCIHVPPPPANQIIHVNSTNAIKGVRTMDAVWISGVLNVKPTSTDMGDAGYSLVAQNVEMYKDGDTKQ
ncbi:DUF3299 domain-containing protein [Glaciimonas sp. Gout2]|uniref:DUF3299 domain-containing protein n=1 Tax=unclassified Glaciimonas TaxID=2644401 RepID=UPI002AB49BBD|nr:MULTISPECIES: DUF3299 domain-containing protein [unclassified Glaciimonas]MDY7548067.1 DUF3299 domain-containing protein [Glaciimonas sp. CA11.2]MEB0010237.1 DUF3299 domain-containing protein [Glaciimonas sp. Cout2]MEB0083736.1 DUF3299 domain-containing protein [Glaciimonas sp. Gout2]